MRNKGLFRLLGVCLVLILAALPFMSACAKPAPEAIIVKFVTFMPLNHPNMAGIRVFVDAANEAAKGELIFESAGGPEAIPMVEQAEAVRTGAIDMAVVPGGVYASLVPEAQTLSFSYLNPMEERKVGFHDAMVEYHKKANLYYLGRNQPHSGFRLFTKQRIEKPEDLAGLKIRSAGVYDEFLQALGTVPVMIPFNEAYPGLQRGVIDGFAWTSFGIIGTGMEELIKCRVDHAFYRSSSASIMNLDKWNSLPKHLQDLLNRIAAETDPKLVDLFKQIEEEEEKKQQEAGIEFIKFPPAVAKRYVDMAYEVKWAAIEKQIPETAPKIRAMITK